MDKSTVIRTAVAAGVAAAGLSVGGVALASADGDSSQDPKPGVAGERHVFKDDLAERLAKELGIPESEVEDALDEVRDELVPNLPDLKKRLDRHFEDGDRPDLDELPAPPSENEIEKHKGEFEKELAEALDVSEDELSDALEELSAAAESGIRDDLESRLDGAVEDGDLTAADKKSVLKAYDAGVIGLPGMGKFFGGGPGLHLDRR